MKKGVRKYSVPMLEVQELNVERGFSISTIYGGNGDPGQDSGYLDNDYEL